MSSRVQEILLVFSTYVNETKPKQGWESFRLKQLCLKVTIAKSAYKNSVL